MSAGNHEASCDHQGCEWYSKNFTAYNFKFRMPGLEENGSNSNMWYSLDYSYAHFVSFSAETDYPNAYTHLNSLLQTVSSTDAPTSPWNATHATRHDTSCHDTHTRHTRHTVLGKRPDLTRRSSVIR